MFAAVLCLASCYSIQFHVRIFVSYTIQHSIRQIILKADSGRKVTLYDHQPERRNSSITKLFIFPSTSHVMLTTVHSRPLIIFIPDENGSTKHLYMANDQETLGFPYKYHRCDC
jgi:hypothetical protein